MRYQAVLFDLDGTLLNTLGDLAAAADRALRAAGLCGIGVSDVRSYIGNGMRSLINRAIAGKKLPPDAPLCCSEERFGKVFSEFLSYYNAHSLDRTAP